MQSLDILNILPKLYVKKREKFTSTLGIFSGTFIILLSIGYIIFFVNEYLKKYDANIVFNEIGSFNPSLNMTNVPFIFKLTNTKGDFYSDQIITFTVQHWKFEKLSNGTPSITTLSYERCQKTKHFKGYEKFFIPYYEQMKIDTYYCLNLENYDLTINGLFGDLINGYSLINLYINECANNTKSNVTNCLAKDDIMKIIGDTNMFFRVSYIDFQIDHKNYSDPYFPYVRSENIQFSYKAKARVYYYLKNVIYKTDIGYFQREMEEDQFFMYDTFLLTYPSVTYQIPNAFGLFSFLISSKAAEFNRSFPKVQSLIANIGGLINGSTFLIRIMLHFFSKESIFIFYMNQIIKPKIDSIKKHNFYINSNNNNQINQEIISAKNNSAKINSNASNNIEINNININKNINLQKNENVFNSKAEKSPDLRIEKDPQEIPNLMHKVNEIVVNKKINFNSIQNDISDQKHSNSGAIDNLKNPEVIIKNNVNNKLKEKENSSMHYRSIENLNVFSNQNLIPYVNKKKELDIVDQVKLSKVLKM